MGTSTRRKLPVWAETGVLLVVAVVLALVIKTFFVQAFYIPSSSMRPGLVVNDRILVEKWSYWFDTPERGDVVVFEDPGGWLSPQESAGPTNPVASVLARIGLYPTGGHLVKRVVGVGGDTIECCDRQGRLKVNGVAVDESDFIAPQRLCDGPMPQMGSCDWSAGPVPEGSLFVMGDNRSASADSSVRLCVSKDEDVCDQSDAFVADDLVVGRVFALAWPPGHAGLVSTPDAFADVPDRPAS